MFFLNGQINEKSQQADIVILLSAGFANLAEKF